MNSENRPKLYLVRHAESIQNVNQNLDRDSSISKLGEKQAIDTGRTLRSIFSDRQPGAIIHTGLTRTIATAQAIKTSGEFDTPLVEIPEFREREMGIYDQMEFSELIARNPGMQSYYEKYQGSCVWFFKGTPGDGVETLEAMKSRVTKGLDEIYRLYQDNPIIVVGHAGSIKMTRMLYEMLPDTNMPLYLSSYVPENCEVYTME